MPSQKISALTASGVALASDELVIARSGANFKMAISEVNTFVSSSFVSTVGRLATDHVANAGTIILENALPSIVADGVWAVVDPFTVQCEIRKITLIAGTTLTIGTNLTFAHSQYDTVLFISDAIANVLWFGAKGDGVADDTLAFQAAVDEVGVSGVGVLYISPGVYPITPIEGSRRGIEISAQSQITITGSREAIVKIADGVNVTTSWGNLFWVSGSTDIILHGFTIDGNDASANSEHGIAIVNSSVRAVVSDMYIHDTTEDGIYIDNSNSVRVQNNHVISSGARGIAVIGGCLNTIVMGNVIDSAAGISIDLQSVSVGALILGNMIIAAQDTAINVSMNECLVSDNQIRDPAGAIVIAMTGTGHIISVNHIYDHTGAGGVIDCNANQSIIDGNQIKTSSGTYGIRLRASSGQMSAINNHVETIGGDGIICTAPDSLIKANHSNENTGWGINLAGLFADRVVIEGNFLEGNGTANANGGISIASLSSNCSIIGNMVFNNDDTGIFLAGDDCIVMGNITIGNVNQDIGLDVDAACSRPIITGNNWGAVVTTRGGSTPASYKPDPGGVFATDMGNFNFE